MPLPSKECPNQIADLCRLLGHNVITQSSVSQGQAITVLCRDGYRFLSQRVDEHL